MSECSRRKKHDGVRLSAPGFFLQTLFAKHRPWLLGVLDLSRVSRNLGFNAISWKIRPMAYQMRYDVRAIWHPIGRIFRDIASYSGTRNRWNPTLISEVNSWPKILKIGGAIVLFCREQHALFPWTSSCLRGRMVGVPTDASYLHVRRCKNPHTKGV